MDRFMFTGDLFRHRINIQITTGGKFEEIGSMEDKEFWKMLTTEQIKKVETGHPLYLKKNFFKSKTDPPINLLEIYNNMVRG